jgi:hypothetical protein
MTTEQLSSATTSLSEVIHRREPPVQYYTPNADDDLQLSRSEPSAIPVTVSTLSTIPKATTITETPIVSSQLTPSSLASTAPTFREKQPFETRHSPNVTSITNTARIPVPWWRNPTIETSTATVSTTHNVNPATRVTYNTRPITEQKTGSPQSRGYNNNKTTANESRDANENRNSSQITHKLVPNVPHIRTSGHPRKPKFPLFNPDVPRIPPTKLDDMNSVRNSTGVALFG